MSKRRFLFVNISYCYDGDIGGHFRYVRENNDAGEKYNFQPMYVNGKNECWGFFEPGFTKGGYDNGGKQRKVDLTRIDKTYNSNIYVDNVTVIWCAYVEELNHSTIIGWYKNAKVYRDVIELSPSRFQGRGLPEFGYVHNVEALTQDCVFLPRNEIMSALWLSPRKKTDGIGFGQSNMWYAEESAAQKYVKIVLDKIDSYSGDNRVI
ncbi:MAG: hypothetical protein QMB62_06270 [Oscillospiraceae bacterium]